MRDGEAGGWTTTRKLRAALAFVLGLAFILVSPRIPNPGGELLHEIGFALVVAVVIWITFHVLSDADQEEAGGAGSSR